MYKTNVQPLNTIDGETLLSIPMEPLNFVVDSLISQGLHILAGAPKVGKSWLALWLATTIAKGESVWNLQTKQGTTLYLCLEDSTRRIQNRLFSITDEVPSSVRFCTESNILEKGLEQQLTQFLKEYPDTVLIIIDTLQKVRGAKMITLMLTTTVTFLCSSALRISTTLPFCSFTICARKVMKMCSTASPVPPPSAVRWIPASHWWRTSVAAVVRNSPALVEILNTER